MRAIHLIILYVALLMAAVTARAQDGTAQGKPSEPQPGRADRVEPQAEWEGLLDDLIDDDDGDDTGAWADMHDVLTDMADHPIDLSAATREDLERLPFLTARQIEDLCQHIDRHGPIGSEAELLMVSSLDERRRRLLMCFAYIGSGGDGGRKADGGSWPSVGDLLRRGRHTLTGSLRVPLYDRRGDRNGYLGYKYKHWVKYDFSSSDRLRFGFIGSQDSGEPFFAAGNGAGYDFYSFYLQIRKAGRLDNLIVGRYRVSAGMGLVMGSRMSFGKTLTAASAGRTADALRVYTSRSPVDYLQGAAATVRLSRRLAATAFASWRPLDATLNDDGTARTIQTSGYHRTVAEMSRKDNTHAADAGARLRYAGGGLSLGLTAVYTHLDRDLRPLITPEYRRYYASGNGFFNAGIDYGYASPWVSLSGETATDGHGAIATLNTVAASLTDVLTVTLLHRHYSHRYVALHAGGFSDGGRMQNESGLCVGADWRPVPGLQLSGYADFVRHARPRYLVSWPSRSADYLLSATLSKHRWTFGARYRLRMRERDNKSKTRLIDYNTHRLRLHAVWTSGAGWSCRTQADMVMSEYRERETGWMVGEVLGWHRRRIAVDMSAALFSTDSYESRIYAYERSLPQTFSCPALYGQGIRYTVMARADIGSCLMLALRLAVTDYFDRSSISSGLQTIDGSSAADIEVQARLRL